MATVLIILALLILPIISYSSGARKLDTSGPAEVNAYVKGDIPSIKTNWTTINVTVVDAFGIDWDKLSATIPEWWMRFIWPLNPQFPQPVQRLLGYTGLRFIPEIIEGDARGWYVKVTPTSVSRSNTGYKHDLLLEVRTDDSAIDYAVVVGIKCIRLDVYGEAIGSSYITIPVKASPLNFVEMKTSETTMKAGLKSTVKFNFDITNKGYYKDVFQFDIKSENGLVALLDQQIISMSSGETKQMTLTIRTPEKLYDIGTGNRVDIYVYSKGDPNRVLVGSLTIITEGVYISPLIGIIAAPIIVVLIIILLLYTYLRKKKLSEYIVKPDKPWMIPEERAYLEELKKKDKNEYKKTLRMMEEEYQSAILWYMDALRNIKNEMKKKKRETSQPSPLRNEEETETELKNEKGMDSKTQGEKEYKTVEEKDKTEQKELDVKKEDESIKKEKEQKEKLLKKVLREQEKMKKQ